MASIVTMQRTHIVISQGVAVRAGYIVPFRHLFAINQLAVLLRVQGGWVAFSCRQGEGPGSGQGFGATYLGGAEVMQWHSSVFARGVCIPSPLPGRAPRAQLSNEEV